MKVKWLCNFEFVDEEMNDEKTHQIFKDFYTTLEEIPKVSAKAAQPKQIVTLANPKP